MDCKLPNKHLIQDGFDRLHEPLADYEISLLRKHYRKDWWKLGVLRVLKGKYHEKVQGLTTEEERIHGLDLGSCLIIMFGSWEKVFRHYSVRVYPGLVLKAYDYATELFDLRNDLAHHNTKDYTPFETKNHLLKMAALCRCFNPEEADRIRALTDKIGKTEESHSVGSEHKVKTEQPKPPSPPAVIGSESGSSEIFITDDSDRPYDISGIVEKCIVSAQDQLMFGNLQSLGKKNNESVVHIESFQVSGTNNIICRITEALVDNSEYLLLINNRPFPGDQVEIPFYDRDEHTLVLSLGDSAMAFFNSQENPELKLVGDLSFLVKNVMEFYSKYGDLIRYPSVSEKFPAGSYPFPTSRNPTDSQKQAVATALNSGLSYIWGAPGTGKTQMTLATALVACVSRGEKVAVVAPTNLAVEQVLRGLISIINENENYRKIVDPEHDILRLGRASEEFLREYPHVCETKIMQSVIDRKMSQIQRLDLIPYERELPDIVTRLKEQQLLSRKLERCTDESELPGIRSKVLSNADYFTSFFSGYYMMHEVGNDNRFITPQEVDRAYEYASEHSHLNRDLAEYFDWTDEARENMIANLFREVNELMEMKNKVDNLDAKIIALTPHNYISRFVPRGFHGATHMKKPFEADHIFLDEAGYCSAILALPLLANGVPVTLLGDHMQLPPVCAADPEAIEKVKLTNPDSFSDPEFMKYWYLWDISSIYLETMFLRNVEELAEIHEMLIPPICRNMQVCTLKESYRFGENLGRILDSTVYKNGIRGHPGDNLRIEVIHVPSPTGADIKTKREDGNTRVMRVNIPEADAITEYVENNPMAVRDFAVLSPYRDQINALNNRLPDYAFRNILTVHRSQGREWDTVLLSVCDSKHTSTLDHPRRFTSILEDGLNLINTAVSRAKHRLIIFCDTEYWAGMTGELVTQLVEEGLAGAPHTVT